MLYGISFTRRVLLTTLILLVSALVNQVNFAKEDAEKWQFDLQKPEDQLETYVKVAGSLDKRQVYIQYYGEIMAILPGQEQQQLFQLKGLIRSRWTPNEDGSYSYENFDHGLFCDYETGEVLKVYQNPFTNEKNTPLHYKSGVISGTIGLAQGQESPGDFDWRQVGDQVVITSAKLGRSFKNPVDPKTWPKASTGEKVYYSWTGNYLASADDISDLSKSSVDADHIWNFVTNYPAWMKMGDAPGHVMWRWVAKKIVNENEIDPYILAEVEKSAPGFLTKDAPWPGRSNGWSQYTWERKPEKQ